MFVAPVARETLAARRARRRHRSRMVPRVAFLFLAWALALPALASAADPDHVQFTLEGCRLPAGATLPNSSGQFVCADADYTPGNLGKNWHELDLVPHRLTAEAGPAQTYTVAIAADHRDGSRPGYDVISVPVVNALLSTGSCAVSAGPQSLLTPGQGGVDVTMYRDLTITQSAGSHCVFDYFERLALGSHLFPGSSLHSNLLNEAHTTAGVGAREVPIPVNQILPQGLSKTMTATTGNSSVWNVTKDSLPTDVNFDTCAGGAMAQARQVTITIRWTKTATSNGSVTIISNITLSNPAARDVSATVQDKIYAGATQTTQVGTTYNSGPTVVPARGTKTLTNVQTIPTSAATSYNDVATATYNEVVPGLPPIPGTVTATASASLVSISTPNNSATVTDREQIAGNGLSFSIDQVTSSDPGGTFDIPYTVGSGARITGPITWSNAVTSSGAAVLLKTIYVAGQLNTTGTLSDTARVVDSLAATPDAVASAATTISARACLQGQKFADADGDGTHDPGEPGLAGVTVYIDLDNDAVFDVGEPSAVTDASGHYSISTATIPDGTYTLREVLPPGTVCTFPSTCSYTLVVGPGGPLTGLDFGNRPAPAVVPPPPPPPPAPPPAPPAAPPGGPTGGSSSQPTVPPRQVTRPTGSATLRGPKRCVPGKFRAMVIGKQIARVRFHLDGKPLGTVAKPNGPGKTFVWVIDPRKYAPGTHRVVARVTFRPSARTKAKVRTITFSGCARRATEAASFTG
jgi:hypothetical protein